jgi:hypoxanthine phosphoribosyltransferase
MRKIKKVTWAECEQWINTATDYWNDEIIVNELVINNIYGIPRGGIIFATMLSHQLDIPLIANKEDIGESTLIVDDIADSGSTFHDFIIPLNRIQGRHFRLTSAIVVNQSSTFLPQQFSFMNHLNDWIEFPYETSAYDHVSKVTATAQA